MLNRDEILSHDNNTGEFIPLKDLTPYATKTIYNEYKNYKYIKNKKMIIAEELNEPIQVINSSQISYKGNIYLLDTDIQLQEIPRK